LIGLGGIVLLGWITGSHSLKTLTWHGVAMKANTAIGLILAGVSVAAAGFGRSRAARVLSNASAGILLCLGLITFSEHLTGRDLGIDQALFHEPPGELFTVSPGRMGPPASLSFSLAGIALLLVHACRSSRRAPSHGLACAMLILAGLPLIGYTTGASEFYGVATLTGIAPHTAFALVLLAVAILFLRPDASPVSILFERSAGGDLARRLLPTALILPPILGWVFAFGYHRRWYDADFGRAGLLLAFMATFTVLVGLTSRLLSRSAGAAERAQQDAMAMRREADHLAVRNLENLSLLNSLLENAPIGFAFFDSKLCFVRANRVLALQNGHSVESHTGRPLREIAPWMSARLEPIVSRVFATGESEHGIELHGSPVGESDIGSTWLVGAFPVRDDAGGVARVGVVLVEITERKRLEEQKAKLLTSERAARAEAEQASVLKDEFLATLSHELRTPLGAITGWTSILRRKESHDPDVVQGLETIDRNTKLQVQLIEDLLDVSRIVSGKLRLDLKPVDLLLVIDAAQSVIAPTADAKGVRLIRTIDGQGPSWIEGDTARLQQIVWNLLSNAVKFTPKGGTIELSLRLLHSHAEVVVADSGVGVDPVFLPHMFERFRQADSSTTRRYGGLGLGLSIVRQLTELHGGKVSVSSPGPSLGTTFVVTFPLPFRAFDEDAGQPVVRGGKPRADIEQSIPPLSGVRVLVVDDETDARVLLKRVLEGRDATVELCGTAWEALHALQSFRPNILVSDIGMPDMDGYELIRRVREEASAQEIPAIALTAFVRPEDRRRAMLAGYQLHISKPADPDEVLAAIAMLTGRSGEREAVEAAK